MGKYTLVRRKNTLHHLENSDDNKPFFYKGGTAGTYFGDAGSYQQNRKLFFGYNFITFL